MTTFRTNKYRANLGSPGYLESPRELYPPESSNTPLPIRECEHKSFLKGNCKNLFLLMFFLKNAYLRIYILYISVIIKLPRNRLFSYSQLLAIDNRVDTEYTRSILTKLSGNFKK